MSGTADPETGVQISVRAPILISLSNNNQEWGVHRAQPIGVLLCLD